MHRTCPSQSVTKLMHYVDDTGVREQTTSPCDKLVTRRAMAGCRDQNGHVGGVVERLSIFRAMRDAWSLLKVKALRRQGIVCLS